MFHSNSDPRYSRYRNPRILCNVTFRFQSQSPHISDFRPANPANPAEINFLKKEYKNLSLTRIPAKKRRRVVFYVLCARKNQQKLRINYFFPIFPIIIYYDSRAIFPSRTLSERTLVRGAFPLPVVFRATQDCLRSSNWKSAASRLRFGARGGPLVSGCSLGMVLGNDRWRERRSCFRRPVGQQIRWWVFHWPNRSDRDVVKIFCYPKDIWKDSPTHSHPPPKIREIIGSHSLVTKMASKTQNLKTWCLLEYWWLIIVLTAAVKRYLVLPGRCVSIPPASSYGTLAFWTHSRP